MVSSQTYLDWPRTPLNDCDWLSPNLERLPMPVVVLFLPRNETFAALGVAGNEIW